MASGWEPASTTRGRGRGRPQQRKRGQSGGIRIQASLSLTCTVPGCKTVFPTSPFSLDLVVESDVGEWFKPNGDKKLRRENVYKLLKMVNALLNSSGGVLYIHVETNMLHFFDEQIDDMLMKLVPDGSLFEDNYEREVAGNHVSLRVKPRDKPPPISTLNYNTKTSTNTGLADLNHLQMTKLIKDCELQQQQQNTSHQKGPTLFLNKDDKLPELGKKIPGFYEHTRSEAKSVKNNKPWEGENLVKHAWRDLKMPERITSFSKTATGGSYFLGIREEQPLQWKETNYLVMGPLVDGRQIWAPIDEPEDENTIFLVARPNQVPTKDNRTGFFLVDGVSLLDGQKDKFKKCLQENVKQKMLWWPEMPKDQFKVFFLELEDQATGNGFAGIAQTGASSAGTDATRYVIEVQIPKWYGLCFTDREGPEAYTIEPPSNLGVPTRIPFKKWLSYHI